MLLTQFRRKPLTQFVLAALCTSAAQLAHAQAAADLGTVQSTATSSSTAKPANPNRTQTAPAQAPTQASLKATEPQSIISRHYIENSTSPTDNWSDIAAIAPSVQSVNPNGPGLMETQGLTIRGFQDGQYNVTFDGIPFGDTNDFTHHSTSFFTQQVINNVTVDRGPGDASQIGFATFGGTLGMTSRDPSTTPSAALIGSYGSFNTWVAGGEFNTGTLQNYGDMRLMFGYTDANSDGYLTGASQRRQNVYFKLEKPIGNDTLVTLFATYTKLNQNVSYGTTPAEIAQYGQNFGLSSNPASQDYKGYNFDLINTDFEYIGLQTKLGGWSIDNKLYTYGYYHNGFNGLDPSGATPNGPASGYAVYGPNDVPGNVMNNNYRSWGDVLRAQRDIGPGTLELGTWLAYQTNYRNNFAADATLNWAYVPNSQNFTMQDQFFTAEPYLQYALKLPYGLTITPGVKYVSFTRHIESPVNQGSGQPIDYSTTSSKVLPSLQLHEQINPHWSAYAQYAQGFLASNLNQLYIPNAGTAPQPAPEQTDNYQIGTTYRTDRLTAGVDLYYINFRNATVLVPNGANPYYANAGGAVYKGVEMEGTYYAGLGFNLYGNLTFNSAKQKATGDWMPNAPKMTAAAGLLYERGPVNGSLITKFIGRQYGTTGNQAPIGGYAYTNLAAGYTFTNVGPWVHTVRVGVEFDNLFNRHANIWYLGGTGDTALYYTLAGRGVFGTVRAEF
ncbi:MAG TPA: TonB-dependent receptor [Trinickia sp.]|uniref:TonB-dependent receptor n=1 Tax=Trinickia sp. TaxID=2571163 RepID=UPI002BB01D22|nr:TonB-dependent receptor [Trinickia sp.]HTI16570.1 TonB-dependent receptor [Trinickia sp.]